MKKEFADGYKSGLKHGEPISRAIDGGKHLYAENERKARDFRSKSPYWRGYATALEYLHIDFEK